jgi:hypothetical protein
MAIADHVVFSAYGFWLPNDPRGSGSDFVRQWNVLRGGPATKVHTRRSVAHVHANFDEDRMPQLQFPPVVFDGLQARAIGEGFAKAIAESGYVVYACSILPQHVHVVAARHEHGPKMLAGHLKGRATQRLALEGRHPLAGFVDADGRIPSPWTVKAWAVFLDTPAEVRREIQYVENNPVRDGKRPQKWSFVTPYVG